jgi:hypothetical protein
MTDPISYSAQTAIFKTSQTQMHMDVTGLTKPDSEAVALFNETLQGKSDPLSIERTGKEPLLIETGKTETPGSKILQNMVSFDKTYQDFFHNRSHPIQKIPAENAIETISESVTSAAQNPSSMLDLVRETHEWAMQASLWSTQLNLLTTTVGKATGGLETLFRNGGG